jgi:4-hydroxybenzoate polyprenyltransferase
MDAKWILPEAVRRIFRQGRFLHLAFVEARPVVQLIYTMRFLAAFALVSAHTPPARWWCLPVALSTWLCASTCAYLFDGVMDVVEDRINGSTRPIASGRLPRRTAAAITTLLALGALAGAAVLGGPYLYLVPLMLALGFAYSAPPVRLKRWSSTSGATVLVAGMLTFAAGGATSGRLPESPTLALFALAMSSWMGLVGAVAKDFTDVSGDQAVGRRTLAVVRGVRHAARRLSGNAAGVAVVFLIAAIRFSHALLGPAVAVLIGAIAVTVTSRPQPSGRRPYRAFMVTQYAAHVAVLVAALAP